MSTSPMPTRVKKMYLPLYSGALSMPARQAFLVDMVGGDDLPSAIAMNASIFNTARVVGPAIAGILVATVGEATCFLLNGASYVAVLWALAGMAEVLRGRSTSQKRMIRP